MSPAIISVTRLAIAQAAIGWGLPNPIAMADELLLVDVDALEEWFSVAGRVQVWLWQGTGRLADALPLLAGGWSRPEPRLAITDQHDAGLAGREVIGRQLDAADETAATLRQSRDLADGGQAQAEAAILGLGWPPAEDLTSWAIGHNALIPVMSIVTGLCERLVDLQARNSDALHALALALRADPSDPIAQLLVRSAATPVIGPGLVDGSALPDPSPTAGTTGIDQENLSKLEADLQSTDIATLAMAFGVAAALNKAGSDGAVAQLLVYESASSTSQGRAAVSVGDITTADNVVVMAPGVSSAPASMSDGIPGATAVRNEAQRQAPGDETAVVAWYGYDAPLAVVGGVPVTPFTVLGNTVSALDDRAARQGGSLLVGDLADLRQWAPEDARFIGMGFSMGATTVSAAAARGAGFDDLVLLGSPGASTNAPSAHNYPQMTADHVYALSYDQDPITTGETDLLAAVVGGIGRLPSSSTPFGPDPAAAEFGAQVIDAPSNNPDISVDIKTGMVLSDLVVGRVVNDLADLANHHQEGNYLSGEALEAIADVVVAQYGDVPVKSGR